MSITPEYSISFLRLRREAYTYIKRAGVRIKLNFKYRSQKRLDAFKRKKTLSLTSDRRCGLELDPANNRRLTLKIIPNVSLIG